MINNHKIKKNLRKPKKQSKNRFSIINNKKVEY